MDLNGDVTRIDAFPLVCISNDPAVSADGHWIYFTESLGKTIYRAAMVPDGNPGKSEIHLTFGDHDGFPDGMCSDTGGGLWVCHFAGGKVTRFLEDGAADRVIDMPAQNVTKCTFGGKYLRTLYVTTTATSLTDEERVQYPLSGGLFAVELDYQGCSVVSAARTSGNVD